MNQRKDAGGFSQKGMYAPLWISASQQGANRLEEEAIKEQKN